MPWKKIHAKFFFDNKKLLGGSGFAAFFPQRGSFYVNSYQRLLRVMLIIVERIIEDDHMPKKNAIERLSRLPQKHFVHWNDFSRMLEIQYQMVIWIEDGIEEYWHGGAKRNGRGRKTTYSDEAIEFTLTLKGLLGFPLRQTVEFVSACFLFTGIASSIPDPSQLSRREKQFAIQPHVVRSYPEESIHLFLSADGSNVRTDGHFFADSDYYHRRCWCRAFLSIDSLGGEIILSIVSLKDEKNARANGFILPEGLDIIDAGPVPISDGRSFFLKSLNAGMNDLLQDGGDRTYEPMESYSEEVYNRRIAPLRKGLWKKETGIFAKPILNVMVCRHEPIV
jgi:hypothetical protein